MKRFFLASVGLLFALMDTVAQELPPIPVDPEVRIGKLDNGLTYYIRHNEFPEKVANFYIAQRVGSIQEEDSQRGLAHFLEHMASMPTPASTRPSIVSATFPRLVRVPSTPVCSSSRTGLTACCSKKRR